MNTVLEMRVRAAGAEMSKPGRWRVARQQLLQATEQILADPDPDRSTVRLTLDNLQSLYAWADVMLRDELTQLNAAVMRLHALLYA
jgi:hypothetical protein